MSAPAAQRPRRTTARAAVRRGPATPILVRQLRNGIEESVHRGDIVEADAVGGLIRVLGDPDRIVTLRSTVKPFGAARAHRGGRGRGVRPRAGRDRDHRQLPFRRGPPRPDDPGHLPARGHQPGAAGLWRRGHAARPADRGATGPRWREGRPDPSHVLRPARRLAAPLEAQGLGAGGLLAAEPSVAGRVSGRGRASLRGQAGRPPDGHRRLRRRDLRLPACGRSPGPTRCWPTRRRCPQRTRGGPWRRA